MRGVQGAERVFKIGKLRKATRKLLYNDLAFGFYHRGGTFLTHCQKCDNPFSIIPLHLSYMYFVILF